MNIARLLITPHPQVISTKAFGFLAGTWLLACVPVLANPLPTFANEPLLIAQGVPINVSLQLGDSGPEVRQLQQALDRNGLFPYTIDGVYGNNTRRSVRQFQRIRRLDVTGLADAETLSALGIDPTELLPRMVHPVHGDISTDMLRLNDDSEDVSVLQAVLNGFGFGLPTTGYYGESTEQAVRAYQRTAGLVDSDGKVNGIADRPTLTHMGFEMTGSFDADNPYVAAVIADESQLGEVRRNFPTAVLENGNLGDYISLGRYEKRDQADAQVDLARAFGYDARTLKD